ncbi:hypothetical protein ACTFIZ_012738 [Dictyostelium cf. discoideum]
MLSRKFNFIILLVCVLFVSSIKSSSSFVYSQNEISTNLKLIVDCNKNNSYSIECGNSLEKSCNNMIDAMNYFKNYVGQLPGKRNSKLYLELVDGTYSSKENNLQNLIGLQIFISPLVTKSQFVIIDGSTNNTNGNFFDYDIKGVSTLPITDTSLQVTNITFVNFVSSDYHIFTSNTGKNNKIKTEYYFIDCKFLNSKNLTFLAYGASSELNGIYFFSTLFENVTFSEYSFNFSNYFANFLTSNFISVSFDGSFISEEEGSKMEMFACNFNQVSFGNKIQNSSFIESRDVSITISSFDQISGTKTSTPSYFFKFSNSVNQINIKNNEFTNVNGGLLELNNAIVNFKSNIISNTNLNSTIIKSFNSNLILDANSFKYTNYLINDQLIHCNIISGSNDYFCSNSTTSKINRTNGSIGKYVSYQSLIIIILIVFSFLNL